VTNYRLDELSPSALHAELLARDETLVAQLRRTPDLAELLRHAYKAGDPDLRDMWVRLHRGGAHPDEIRAWM
jgi:hypothetical protein